MKSEIDSENKYVTDELTLSEQEVERRLNSIRNSEKVKEFIARIKEEAENSGMSVKFKYRIKENQSAINKFRKHKNKLGIEDPEIWDSCGIMLVVQDEEEMYKFVKYIKEKLTTRENGLRDYMSTPKAGYRSIHLYSTFEADGIVIPAEIQIKTEAMSIAQDTLHDSVYKLQELPYTERKALSSAMFSIFEKSADADRFEKCGNLERANILRADVKQARIDNEQLFSENKDIVDNVWKEYGKVLFIHHNIDEIEGAVFLTRQGLAKEHRDKLNRQLHQFLDKMFEYYKKTANYSAIFPSVSGAFEVDYAIDKLNKMDYRQFIQEFKNITREQQKSEQILERANFRKTYEVVIPADRQSEIIESFNNIKENIHDIDSDTER